MVNIIDPRRTDKCHPKSEAVNDSATIAMRPNPRMQHRDSPPVLIDILYWV